MNNLFKTITINEFNTQIENMINMDIEKRKEQSSLVNNIRLLAASDTSKLSVTISPDNVEKKEFYFGLHPSFDEKVFISIFKEIDLHNREDFWKLVKKEQKKYNYFSLGEGNDWNSFDKYMDFNLNKQHLETLLLGRAILQMATHLGIELIIKKGEEQLFKSKLKKVLEIKFEKHNLGDYVIQHILDNYFKIDNKGILKAYGIWLEDILSSFDENFCINKSGNKLVVSLKKDFTNTIVANQSSLKSILKENIKLIGDSVYYSGVLPRALEVKFLKEHTGSNNIKYISLRVQRTTFATVDMMDNPLTLFHPHIMFHLNYFKALQKFDQYEDEIQKEHLYKITNDELELKNFEEKEIEKVNNYLKKSFNTHGIAVSANILTQDGYLIIGKRDPYSIDSGEYYPSANGQAEFVDENVDFYQMSVYEDLPTLNYSSKMRLDLNHEIQREALAELGVGVFKHGWNYYGLSYLSINNSGKETQEIYKRRMHFNVLTSNETTQTFSEVVETQKHATESFESIQIEGIKLNLYKSVFSMIKEKANKFTNYCYQNMGIATIFILLASTILSFLINFFKPTLFHRENILDHLINEWNSTGFELIITVLILFFLCIRFIQNRNIWKLKINRSKIINSNQPNKDDMFTIKEQRRKTSSHKLKNILIREKKLPSKRLNPVTRVLYAMHYLEKLSRLE